MGLLDKKNLFDCYIDAHYKNYKEFCSPIPAALTFYLFIDSDMAEGDLLILTLLKIPVAIIRLMGSSAAMLTYLPNYVLILTLDAIIFSARLASTWQAYVLSWPFRAASLVLVTGIFSAEFYYLYSVLKIEEMHWVWQVLIMLICCQIILGLMRHGYLSMIKKFDPVKLKSPVEHLV